MVALGKDFLGLAASAAARPVNSVPPKAKAAVTKTEQKPLNPLRNAPGSYQYFAIRQLSNVSEEPYKVSTTLTSDITTIIRRNTTTVDNDTEYDESSTSDDLDNA